VVTDAAIRSFPIGIVNSVGNLGGYTGPNVAVWTKLTSVDPSAPLYVIDAILLFRSRDDGAVRFRQRQHRAKREAQF
jgi:hypothetical protein